MGQQQQSLDIYSFDVGQIDLSKLPPDQHDLAYKTLVALEKQRAEKAIRSLFPASGPLARDKYPKHMEFFRLGATKKERLFLAGNRCGKSVAAATELAFHATGEYPDWWEGYRFKRGIKIYAAGKTAKNTRDICQFKLLGEFNAIGTGTIPKEAIIGEPVSKPGVPQAVEMVYVKHSSGSITTIYFKSFDQGPEAFMGTEMDLIWEDEEPPISVHSECLVRLMTTDGLLMLTFTPLEGMTEVVTSYLNTDLTPDTSRAHVGVVNCGWNDVPHLSQAQKDRLLSSTPPFLREARSKGIPSLGAGAVYPIPEEEFTVEDFPIPEYWPRLYALDVGWKRTAAIWGALDKESDTIYLYSEYYKGQEPPAVHAEAIKSRGPWIAGVADWAGTNQDDGTRMIDKYVELGLEISPAIKSVEPGLYEVWRRLTEGRLKVFRSLTNFFGEFRLYQRDQNGKVSKRDDHLMDCMRYLTMSVNEVAKNKATIKFQRSKAHRRNQYARWSM